MPHVSVPCFLSCRAHPRSGSVQTSPTSTPMSSRRGRQLPQLPPTGKDRSKSCRPCLFIFYGYCLQSGLNTGRVLCIWNICTWSNWGSETALTLMLRVWWGRIAVCWRTCCLNFNIRVRILIYFLHYEFLCFPLIHNISTWFFLFYSQKMEMKEHSHVKVCIRLHRFSPSHRAFSYVSLRRRKPSLKDAWLCSVD